MKNNTQMKKSWKEIKIKLKQKFAILTEKDVLFEESKQGEMIKRLQIKLGKTKEEVLKLIAEL